MIDVDALRRSGKVLEDALRRAFKLLDSGERNGLAIADQVESAIDASARNAFPCNVGLDNVAAHYSPTDDDPAPLSGDLVKIDAGAHIDGWISDAAFTYVLNPGTEVPARAALEALEAAIAAMKPGVPVSKIGSEISAVARKYGLKPISNLGGHQIERYTLHAGLFIPNVPEGTAVIEEGMQIAIEPFITNGRGHVSNGSKVTIFSLERPRARTPLARKVLKFVQDNYGPLPFAQKWVERQFGPSARLGLYELARSGAIYQYPVLLESPGSTVAQFETTVYVDSDGAEPLVDVFDLVSW